MDFDGVQQELVSMLDGQRAHADISGFTNSMTDIASKDDMYALLVHLGYLGYDAREESVFIPKPGSALPPMVVELKWDRPVGTALAQIRERNYPAALAGLGGECVLVGVTYRDGTDEHECRIERIAL